MYLTSNEGKSPVAEKLIRSLKNTIYKHKIEVSKNVYNDSLDEIVDKYNEKYHGTIKMKPPDVQPSIYIEYCVQHNDKDPKSKDGDRVRITKCKNIFYEGIHSKLV